MRVCFKLNKLQITIQVFETLNKQTKYFPKSTFNISLAYPLHRLKVQLLVVIRLSICPLFVRASKLLFIPRSSPSDLIRINHPRHFAMEAWALFTVSEVAKVCHCRKQIYILRRRTQCFSDASLLRHRKDLAFRRWRNSEVCV